MKIWIDTKPLREHRWDWVWCSSCEEAKYTIKQAIKYPQISGGVNLIDICHSEEDLENKKQEYYDFFKWLKENNYSFDKIIRSDYPVEMKQIFDEVQDENLF